MKFAVPNGGKAVLRLVNGARAGASISERVASADISLNGRRVATVRRENNVTESYVGLAGGFNVLKIDNMAAEPGRQLSMRIDACADRIALKRIINAGVAGEPMKAEATVTALGMPLRNIEVQFEVLGTGLKKRVRTGSSGTASTSLDVADPGPHTLKAAVVGRRQRVVDETSIKVLAKRGLVLDQRPHSLRLAVGSERLVALDLNMKSVEGAKDRVTLDCNVEPKGAGLTATAGFPAGGIDIRAPRQVPVSIKAVASKPGIYTVTTTATINDTGETYSVVLPVDVVKPGAQDRLLLGIPMAKPAGVKPKEPAKVVFQAQVDGTSTPPELLFLDELDFAGRPLRLAVTELQDTGKDADAEAGDLIYSGAMTIERAPSELKFRVRAAYFGAHVTSGATTFLVTHFPQKARPSDPRLLVPHPSKASRVFSNEVEIKVIPGLPPEAVKMIADSIDGKVVGVIPPLRIYLIEFPGDGSFDGVKKAIATLSTFSHVRRAAPNFEMVNASITFNTPPHCEASAAGCPNDGGSQWYLDTIGARNAWEQAGGGASSAKVTVIDGGIDCNHSDLTSRCSSGGSNQHATQVAGIIAANANNSQGIAGIAWNTELNSIKAGVSDGNKFKDAMATGLQDTKIVNISQKVHLDDSDEDISEKEFLRDAVCLAVDAGKLVVVAGGNIANESDEDSLYPARFSEEISHTCTGPDNRKMVSQLLTVGGSNAVDGRATWLDAAGVVLSSDAGYLDIYAPGVDICTINCPAGVSTVNGTSFATAMVSGAAAVLWAHTVFNSPPGETRAAAVRTRLKETADAVPLVCSNCKRLNIAAAVNVPSTTGIVAGFDPHDSVTLTAIIGPQRFWAQTFRPPASTSISRVGIALVADTNPDPADLGYLTIQIRKTTAAGIPSEEIIGSVSIPGATISSNNRLFDNTFTEHPLTTPVALDAGQLYAIVVTTDSPVVDSMFGPYKWSGRHTADPYADGNSLLLDNTPDSSHPGIWDNKGGDDDLGFRVIAGP